MGQTSSRIYYTKLFFCLIAVSLIAAIADEGKVGAEGADAVSFNRDIRPIFSDTCYRCHGPDKNARQAGLRLDLREESTKKTKSGIIPIVPGNPEESEIVRRIFASEEAEVMPPKWAHKELTTKQKELIKRWVAQGAKYEGHWAYQPIRRPAVPQINDVASVPIHNPIDAFIRTRLTNEGLSPSPEADRRTLIRRVSLDLTGIPPTPQEVAAFVSDKSPDAFEKIVDRLLNSPRYAEKQAMHWLDAVRYADTAGFHGDNAFPAWPYRDYVLRAFRDNKPFDEFAREQIAGDLVPSATTEQRIASAYNRLNRVSAEGGLQPKEYLAKYGADRVRTTSVVWLGLTMGCAECHDHKFDPILTKDFYSMKAFFADIKETGLVPDRGGNAWGSKLLLPSVEQKKRGDDLSQQLAWLNAELDEKARKLRSSDMEWEERLLRIQKAGDLSWQFQHPIVAKAANDATLTVYNDEPLTVTIYRGGNLITEQIKGDGLVVASGANPENETYTVSFKPGEGEWVALGIEVVQDASLPANRLARGADRFVLSEVEAELSRAGANRAGKLDFVLATTDGVGELPENRAMNAIDGDPKTGWGTSYADNRGSFLALRLAQKLETGPDSVVTVRLRQDSELRRATIGRFRLALSKAQYSWPDHTAKTPNPMNGLPEDVVKALKVPAANRTKAQETSLFEFFKWSSSELQPLIVRRARLEAELELLNSQIPRVVTTETMMPAVSRVLARGNFLDESGEVVEPAIPVVFGKLDAANRRATRLDLANWIASKENPLTARVYINRLWREFFGTGLTKTLDDLGSQGEWPTHPELLDWLASEFMHPTIDCGLRIADCGLNGAQKHDWDVKHIIRLIVTSHTYRQSSNPQSATHNPQSAEDRDPDNRLLARQNRFRVEAETVHDIALAVSGLLVEKFGGPPVRPYQPDRYLAMLNFPMRDYSADHGESLYRRGVYTHWQRTYLHPSLLVFDAPPREECTVNRVSSNTPLQALTLLNDPIYVEAARVFAENTLKQGGGTINARIDWDFLRALGRKPEPKERQILSDLYRKSLREFQSDPKSAKELISIGDAPLPKNVNAPELAAMTTVTRAILNLHEMITRN
jgi:uncharacterized protein DUF1553/uncharacterized protein DUF1549/cytochrome c